MSNLILLLSIYLCGISKVCVKAENLTYTDINLGENKYLVDTKDSQVAHIAREFNKKFNQQNFSSKYVHLSRVEKAEKQVDSGIVWYLRVLVSSTDCMVDQLDFEKNSLDQLGNICKADSEKYDKYYCNFVGKTNAEDKMDLTIFNVECVL